MLHHNIPINIQNTNIPPRYYNLVQEASNRLYSTGEFNVEILTENFNDHPRNNHAKLLRVFFMRSDLHDFTKKVQEAFKTGKALKIQELLSDFTKVLQYGENFIDKANRPIIGLPWAGDCANLLILPKQNESIDDARLYYPAVGLADWLTGYDGIIPKPFSDAKWLSSICLGNQNEGNGNTLIATVHTRSHSFLFAIGWNAGRSQDAQTLPDTKANEGITSNSDYIALDDNYHSLFHPANTIFMKSGKLISASNEIYPHHIDKFNSAPKKLHNTCISIPTPKPFYHN